LKTLELRMLEGRFAVWQATEAQLDDLGDGELLSVTRTRNEISVVGPPSAVPPGALAEDGWRCLEVAGPLPFDVTGVLAAISRPLADAGIPIFVISTFNTDYVLVKEGDVDRAAGVLRAEGFAVDD
jgi:hypothetical protein